VKNSAKDAQNMNKSVAVRCRYLGDRIMIFWGVVGCFFFSMLIVAVEEKRRSRGMIERLRSEVLNHQRKNAMSEYHEPGTWRK